MIRLAHLDDLNQLEQLEKRCFTTDRLSRRQLRYLLTKGKASLLVGAEEAVRELSGYVAVLYSKATSMARLYSIAVRPEWKCVRIIEPPSPYSKLRGTGESANGKTIMKTTWMPGGWRSAFIPMCRPS